MESDSEAVSGNSDIGNHCLLYLCEKGVVVNGLAMW